MNSPKNTITTQELYQQQSEALYELVMSSDQKWRKQWASEAFSQRNANTNTPYNNLNQTLLFNRAVKEDNNDPRWLTFNQIKEKGYKLNKGSKGSKIYRVVRQYDRILKDDNGNAILDEHGKTQTESVLYSRPLLKVHTVFNARDIEGIEPFKLAEIPEEHKLLLQQEKYRNAEAMINHFCEANGIKLKEISSERAFYQGNNGNDEKQVVVPLKSQFDNLNDYFAVLFHEVGHSTKALGIRINTETDTPAGNIFGSENYAKEELTAELTALFLCKQFGIDSTATAEQEQNSFAYLQSWVIAGLLDKEDFHTAVIEANRATKAIFSYAPEMSLSIDDLSKKESISQAITPDNNIIQDLIKIGNKEQELSQGTAHYINDKLHPEKITADLQLIEHLSKTLGKEKLSELRKEADNYLRQDLNNKAPKKTKSTPLDLNNIGLTIRFSKGIEDQNGKFSREKEAQELHGKEAFKRLEEILRDRPPYYVQTTIKNNDFENIGLRNPMINSVSHTFIPNTPEQIKEPFEFIKHQFDFIQASEKRESIMRILDKYAELSKPQNNNLLQNYNNTITTENIKEYITGYNENQIDTLRHPDFKGIKLLYSQATKDYFASQDPNAYKGNPYVEAQRQAKSPADLLNSSVDKMNSVAEKLSHHNIKLIPFSESSKIPQDDLPKQVDKMFKEKNTMALLHLNSMRKGKSFDDINAIFNIEKTSQKPDYQRYIDLGYMEHLGKKEGSYNTHYYKLTEKGIDLINNKFEYALQIEKQKIGKAVTIKEYEELSKNLNNRHNSLTGGTSEEFAKQNYPEKMTPFIEQGKEMLKRPFNVHSLPYQGALERDIKRIETTMNLWDKAQLDTLKTTNGEEIKNIKFLWGETNTSEQNKAFGTDLEKLQNWLKQNYSESEIANNKGYFKNNFQITYTNNSGENISFEKRIDIGKNPNDFNPYRENIKTYLEKILDRQFIKQNPKLSKTIQQELQEKTKHIKVKQQGITTIIM